MTTLSEYAESRELMANLTLRELRSKYKRSILGWAWSLLNPLATMVIFTVVFRFFLRIQPPTGEPSGLTNFALFLLGGLLPWNFLVAGTTGSIGTLVANATLIQKTYFPRELLVVSQVASWLVSFGIEMVLLSIAFLVFGNMVLPYLPVVVLLMVVLSLFTTGFALAFSVLNVYFRDVQHLVSIGFQVWFYMSPILYPIALVPERATWFGRSIPVRDLYELNPMVAFVEAFRDCLYDLRLPSLGTAAYLLAFSAIVFLAGLALFTRLEGRLAEEL